MEAREEGGGLEQESAEFHRALRELVRVHLLRERDRVGAYEVSVSGAHALDALDALGPLSLNQVAAELFVDKSTACRVVGALEDRGHGQRLPDDRDGRAIRIELTPAGRRLQAQLRGDAAWEVQAMLAGFPPEARQATLRFLRRLTRTSALHAGAAGASCC